MQLPLRPPAAAAAFTGLLTLSPPVAAFLHPPELFRRGTEQAVLSAGRTGVDGDGGAGEGGRGEVRKNPLDDKFEEFVQAALDRWRVPGLAVAVVDGDDTWAEGYGIASFPSTPVTPSTLFYTGSTTKAFTAAILSLLIASGNFSFPPSPAFSSSSALNWQTPISHILPEDFVLAPEYTWAAAHLTLEDLLSHRTGFPRHDKALAQRYGADRHKGTVRDVVRSLRFLPMVGEPRVTWRYCNLMFMTAAHAIQTLTGQWLGDTLREWIWEPLGMNETFFSVEDALNAGAQIAGGYYWDYVGEKAGKGGEGEDEEGYAGGGFVSVPLSSLDLASGAGGIVSNVLDYAHWVRCLIRGDGSDEKGNGCPILPPEAHRELKTSRIVLPASSRGPYDAPLTYALGWEAGTYRGHRVFTHSGGMEAYGAEVHFLPDDGFGVITLGNTALTSNVAGLQVVWKLIDDKLGVPEKERYDLVSRGKEALDGQLKLAETAVETLYPEHADPPLPRGLPLKEYAGVYSHPAYQNMTLKVVDEGESTTDHGQKRTGEGVELKAVRDDMEWAMVYEFVHVSGEFWAVVIDMFKSPNLINAQLARAEFVVGIKGEVDKLRMEFLEEGREGIIVFDKVA